MLFDISTQAIRCCLVDGVYLTIHVRLLHRIYKDRICPLITWRWKLYDICIQCSSEGEYSNSSGKGCK